MAEPPQDIGSRVTKPPPLPQKKKSYGRSLSCDDETSDSNGTKCPVSCSASNTLSTIKQDKPLPEFPVQISPPPRPFKHDVDRNPKEAKRRNYERLVKTAESEEREWMVMQSRLPQIDHSLPQNEIGDRPGRPTNRVRPLRPEMEHVLIIERVVPLKEAPLERGHTWNCRHKAPPNQPNLPGCRSETFPRVNQQRHDSPRSPTECAGACAPVSPLQSHQSPPQSPHSPTSVCECGSQLGAQPSSLLPTDAEGGFFGRPSGSPTSPMSPGDNRALAWNNRLENMTVEELHANLLKIKFGEKSDIFFQNCVDGQLLCNMDDDMLRAPPFCLSKFELLRLTMFRDQGKTPNRKSDENA